VFEIKYAKSINKDLEKIDVQNLAKIKKGIENLRNFPNVSNIRKLSAHPLADYRLRVGEYRVLFDVSWNEKIIYILKIGHRSEVY